MPGVYTRVASYGDFIEAVLAGQVSATVDRKPAAQQMEDGTGTSGGSPLLACPATAALMLLMSLAMHCLL
jgi:secreted trypsin-like serine protease